MAVVIYDQPDAGKCAASINSKLFPRETLVAALSSSSSRIQVPCDFAVKSNGVSSGTSRVHLPSFTGN